MVDCKSFYATDFFGKALLRNEAEPVNLPYALIVEFLRREDADASKVILRPCISPGVFHSGCNVVLYLCFAG